MATARASALESIDPIILAQGFLRRKKCKEASDICTRILEQQPSNKAAWFIKVRAETQMLVTDETELEEEGMADAVMDDNATAETARPGTSFSRPVTGSGTSQAIRPMTRGRPVTGFARPGTTARPSTMADALKVPRTATARPVTGISGRQARLGTASILSDSSGPFINLARIDLAKYATQPALGKALFQYLLYVANDTRKALELATNSEAKDPSDWHWKSMVGICQYRLGLLREAEKQFCSALDIQPTIFTALLLGKVYIRLDRPQQALATYIKAMDQHPFDTTTMAACARTYEAIGDMTKSTSLYTRLLSMDSTNTEAVASLAASYFYTDQPEKALILYRRLTQMGMKSAELFNNLGLCCYYAQQFDMAMNSFESALELAEDDIMADIWYNISHVALGLGDMSLSYQCLKLTIVCDANHSEAYNNLGVLEHHKRNYDRAYTQYLAAKDVYEAKYNAALLASARGNYEQAYQCVTEALNLFPENAQSKSLLVKIQKIFLSL
eukprot:m.32998 g.32998  ORF g.32998 m.32998 type:complete len:502 (-) comp8476_c0_seq3:215-1720(-)